MDKHGKSDFSAKLVDFAHHVKSMFTDFDSQVESELKALASGRSDGSVSDNEDSAFGDLDSSIVKYIQKNYRINDPDACSEEEADRVTELYFDADAKHTGGLARFKNLHTVRMHNVTIGMLHFHGVKGLKRFVADSCRFFVVDMTDNLELETVTMRNCRWLRKVNLSTNTKLTSVSVNPLLRIPSNEEEDDRKRPILYLSKLVKHDVFDYLSDVVLVLKW